MPQHSSDRPTDLCVVVSSDPARLEALGALVGRTGLRMQAFADVESALKDMSGHARADARPPENLPALIVADLCMPGIGGWQFCRLLHSPQYPAFNEIPILILSPAFAGHESDCIAAGLGVEAFRFALDEDGDAFVERVNAILQADRRPATPRVLIIEGDKAEADALQQAFTAAGYPADIALDPQSAVGNMASTPYGLVVLSDRMLDDEGPNLLDKLTESGAQRPSRVTIVAATNPEPEQVLDWMMRGVAAYLRKPFEPDDLLELCAKVQLECASHQLHGLLESRTDQLRDCQIRHTRLAEKITDYVCTVHVENGAPTATKHGPGCQAVTGFQEHEFDQNPYLWLDMVLPEDRDRVIEHARRAAAGQDTPPIEHRIVRPDGKTRWVRSTPVYHRNAQGALTSYDNLIQDITERKRAEEALKASEERLNLAMEVKNEGVWDWNLVTNETSFDDRYYTMAGYAPGEFPQNFTAWAEHVHPDDAPDAEAAIMAYLSGQSECFDIEFRFKHKDGSWIWIQGRGKIVARDEHGSPMRMIGTHTDITDRKRAEESLRNSQGHLQCIFSIAPTGIGVVRDRVLLEVNKRVCEMTGFCEEELVGKNARILYPTQEDYDYVGEEKYRQIRENGTGAVETRWRHKDGAVLDILLASTPLDQSDMSKGVTFTALDITERKQAEARRLQENMRWQRQTAVLTSVASSDYLAEGSVRELAIALTAVVARTVEIERVGVWLFNEDESQLTCVSNYVASTGEHSSGAVLLEHQFSNEFEVLKNSSFIDAHDALTDPRTAGYIESYVKPNRITSMLEARIRSKGRNMGVLCFEHVDRPHRWQDDEIAFACRLADQVALAISHRERRLAEEALRESEGKLSALFTSMTEMVVLHEIVFGDDGRPVNYRITDCNKAYTEITGILREAAVGKLATEVYGTEEPPYLEEFCRVGITGKSYYFETHFSPMGKHFIISVVSPGPNKFATVTTDITAHKQAEEERERLQDQLSQAQKMESVGRLAGGVAHDFNNMLGVILGRTELALEQAEPAGQLHNNLQEIRRAAERSAALTTQLLAFARKQTVAHRVFDLNQSVASLLEMLRRLIGENIDLVWAPGEDLGSVKMDPSQVDQILANLCVNARDAIDDTGKITIETASAVFDEAYCALHAGFLPGRYVMLAVSDDGCGMDPETLSSMFEPFFTTKETGKGTGLGLPMVYGIVKQNSGFINVYSEPGQGTTFRIYLTRHDQAAAPLPKAEPVKPGALRGHETVLLVEDEAAILSLTTTMLERFGYKVLPASTPSEAIRLAEEHKGEIHLLMTDVVMPEMNGRDLARHLQSLYPDLRPLFMSGYTASVIAHQGVLEEGVHFIQKPFTMQSLAPRVKEVLAGC